MGSMLKIKTNLLVLSNLWQFQARIVFQPRRVAPAEEEHIYLQEQLSHVAIHHVVSEERT
jgi:hypothetical protein